MAGITIDWNPFVTGQRQALALDRELLNYGQEYQKAFDSLEAKVENDNVNTYLSSIPENQTTAAALGQNPLEFWQNQQESVLRDPQFARLLPTTRQKILSRIREGAQASITNEFNKGNLEASRATAETMGLTSPSTQVLEAMQAENPAALSNAMGRINQNWQGVVGPDGTLTLNGQQVPAADWLAAQSRHHLNQPGAAADATLSAQNLSRQLEAQEYARGLQQQQLAARSNATQLQATTLLQQLQSLQQTPQTVALAAAIRASAGLPTQDTTATYQSPLVAPTQSWQPVAPPEPWGLPGYTPGTTTTLEAPRERIDPLAGVPAAAPTPVPTATSASAMRQDAIRQNAPAYSPVEQQAVRMLSQYQQAALEAQVLPENQRLAAVLRARSAMTDWLSANAGALDRAARERSGAPVFTAPGSLLELPEFAEFFTPGPSGVFGFN